MSLSCFAAIIPPRRRLSSVLGNLLTALPRLVFRVLSAPFFAASEVRVACTPGTCPEVASQSSVHLAPGAVMQESVRNTSNQLQNKYTLPLFPGSRWFSRIQGFSVFISGGGLTCSFVLLAGFSQGGKVRPSHRSLFLKSINHGDEARVNPSIIPITSNLTEF